MNKRLISLVAALFFLLAPLQASAQLFLTDLSGFGAGDSGPQATVVHTDNKVIGGGGFSYNFVSTNLGVAPETGVTKQVFVGISINTSSINNVTIDGNSATAFATATDGARRQEIWGATASSTSGTIAINLSGAGADYIGIGVWAVYGAQTSAYDTASATGNTLNASIPVPSGGVVIGSAHANDTGATTTFTWTNLTERFDQEILAGSTPHTGASDSFPSEQTLSVTATPSNTAGNEIMVLLSLAPSAP